MYLVSTWFLWLLAPLRFYRTEIWYSLLSALKITVRKFMLKSTAVWHVPLQVRYTAVMST